MRKWLLLFLVLLLPVLAQADGLSEAMPGMWICEDDAPGLAEALYFRTDGSVLLFDVADTHSDGTARRLSHRETGEWSRVGGTLHLALKSGAQELPIHYMTPDDWSWSIDGLRIDGRDYLGYSAGNLVDAALLVSDGVMEAVRAFHPDAVIEDYAELNDVNGVPRSFVLFRERGRRQLNVYRPVGDHWECDVDMYGVPQIEAEDVSIGVNPAGGKYSDLWECEEYQHLYPEGPAITVYTGNGEHVLESATYVWQDQGPYLVQYTFSPNAQVDIVGDDLVFYNISWGMEGRVRVKRDWSWYAVDFDTLPRQVEDVRISGDEAPEIPDYGGDHALAVQAVRLTPGKRWNVYVGPGKQYGRAGSGKAVVSTNGWVQVFGEYDGWLLIQYGISGERYRFGWISDDALAAGERAAPLSFTWNDHCTLGDAEVLTDDPLNSKTAILSLSITDGVVRLAELGESWSYVLVQKEGKTWFGFIPSYLLGHG